jgi:coenzyme F420-reducing hydrogenase beta subunit
MDLIAVLFIIVCLFGHPHVNEVLSFSPTRTLVTPTTTATVRSALSSFVGGKPIPSEGWPDKFPAKEHCSRCGLCETSFVSQVKEACAFLEEGMGRIDAMETTVHGRGRNLTSLVWSSPDSRGDGSGNKAINSNTEKNGIAEEARFGVLHQPVLLAQGVNIPNAQWTGCVTGIALSMLESGKVDAVVCIAKQEGGGWSSSEPILARTKEDVMKGRGVKPALAPSLRVLDEIKTDPSIKRLLFCGVGCAVQGNYCRAVVGGESSERMLCVGYTSAINFESRRLILLSFDHS